MGSKFDVAQVMLCPDAQEVNVYNEGPSGRSVEVCTSKQSLVVYYFLRSSYLENKGGVVDGVLYQILGR